jgi:hypothetical protein
MKTVVLKWRDGAMVRLEADIAKIFESHGLPESYAIQEEKCPCEITGDIEMCLGCIDCIQGDD